jgi:hypothetical protein
MSFKLRYRMDSGKKIMCENCKLFSPGVEALQVGYNIGRCNKFKNYTNNRYISKSCFEPKIIEYLDEDIEWIAEKK